MNHNSPAGLTSHTTNLQSSVSIWSKSSLSPSSSLLLQPSSLLLPPLLRTLTMNRTCTPATSSRTCTLASLNMSCISADSTMTSLFSSAARTPAHCTSLAKRNARPVTRDLQRLSLVPPASEGARGISLPTKLIIKFQVPRKNLPTSIFLLN